MSLRSVFGMNGVLADGATTGFKSIVVAQFTWCISEKMIGHLLNIIQSQESLKV